MRFFLKNLLSNYNVFAGTLRMHVWIYFYGYGAKTNKCVLISSESVFRPYCYVRFIICFKLKKLMFFGCHVFTFVKELKRNRQQGRAGQFYHFQKVIFEKNWILKKTQNFSVSLLVYMFTVCEVILSLVFEIKYILYYLVWFCLY